MIALSEAMLQFVRWLAISGFGLAAGVAQAGEDEPVFHFDTQRVDLHVSVLDKQGRLVTGIPESAFKVWENGVAQSLRLFRREDVPVTLGILIDGSASMRNKRARVAAAALALIKESNPRDEVFMVNFNERPYLMQGLTHDIQTLEHALQGMEARGGTAMRDAVSLSIDWVKMNGTREKKVLVVVTDGSDNSSEEKMERLLPKVRRSEVLIYCIGLLNADNPHDARDARTAMKALAEASGGLDYYPRDLMDVESVTPVIAHEIRSQYLLEYSPTNQVLDGSFRKIKVSVNGQGRVNVRTRTGYYATPDPVATAPR